MGKLGQTCCWLIFSDKCDEHDSVSLKMGSSAAVSASLPIGSTFDIVNPYFINGSFVNYLQFRTETKIKNKQNLLNGKKQKTKIITKFIH